jgi:hypothetical protein
MIVPPVLVLASLLASVGYSGVAGRYVDISG